MIKIKSTLKSTRFAVALLIALLSVSLAPLEAKAGGPYNVTYSNSGASSGTAPVTAGYNGGVTVTTASSTSMVKTGFTFSGWNTAQDMSGTTYTAGQTFTMPESAVTLYPIWRGTINYSANGGLGSPTATSQTYNWGQSLTLTTVGTLTRSTYAFLGWSNTALVTSYTSGGSALATASISASPITLYAAWGRTYTLAINGATLGSTPSSRTWIDQSLGDDLSTVGLDLKKRAYDFAGWSTSSYGSPFSGLFVPTYSGQTIYAAWTAQPVKKTFYVNFKSKKTALSAEEQEELTEFAKTFEPAALFPKSKIQIFIGSIRHRTASSKLGKDRIDVITKFLKSQGVTAKFLWSNDTRNSGKIADANNNRAKIISTWVN